MSRTCPMCKENKITILGTGYYGDTIEVDCSECGIYEVEPDGLDEGGMEWVEAKIKDQEDLKNDISN